MPLDRLVLILVIVIAAAGATVWLVALLASSLLHPGLGALIAVPVLLVAYILWRVIADRVSKDDPYDRIDR